MNRDSFVFYRTFAQSIYSLSDVEMRDRLCRALFEYALDGTEPKLSEVEAAIFTSFRFQIDKNNKRYENGCKGAKHGIKGAGYGKLGGRPRKKETPQRPDVETDENKQITPQIPPKNPRNVYVNVNDNVLDTTVVVSNAREVFCKTYAITDDDGTASELDFEVLSKAYLQSAKFLQVHKSARRMSWIVKHYGDIISGKYIDYATGGGTSSPHVRNKSIDDFPVED